MRLWWIRSERKRAWEGVTQEHAEPDDFSRTPGIAVRRGMRWQRPGRRLPPTHGNASGGWRRQKPELLTECRGGGRPALRPEF